MNFLKQTSMNHWKIQKMEKKQQLSQRPTITHKSVIQQSRNRDFRECVWFGTRRDSISTALDAMKS